MAAAGSTSAAAGLHKRVVGGSNVSASGDYGYVANIVVGGKDGSAGVCTGAVIAPNVVLTSAGCVADSVSNKAVAPSTVIVGQGAKSAVVGNSTVSLSEAVAKYGYAQAQTITVHPGFNSIAYTDNIAIVQLAQPLAGGSVAKVISKPGASAGAAYTGLGWGSTVAEATGASEPSAGPFPSQLQQVQLSVGTKAACSNVWAPYANLTNSLCVVPVKASANVCNGDGLLVKTANDKSVGIAGLLNIVAVKGDVPAEVCNNIGATDYFTTFTNYISWITQVTPLKESDFVSRASFTYDTVAAGGDSDSGDDTESSDSEHESESHGGSSSDDEGGLDSVESSSATALRLAGAAAAPLVALLASAALF
ncbi:hypothetical protein GGI07_001971 [Coemansia sp. Benny D115]|nr:hypothetical protein GGI07_001971 [Coemansia sp. Benny D115]